MHTRRSFLAFAAAAQVIAPLARAMSVRDCRPIVARLPGVMLQTHAGRDVYFCNDLVSGRLAILNLQYDDCARLCLPPPRPGRQRLPVFADPAARHRQPGRPAPLHGGLRRQRRLALRRARGV